MADIKDRIKSLRARQDRVIEARNRLAAESKLKKEQLSACVQEIRAAGYQPETLQAELEKAEKDLLAKIEEFEAELTLAEQACKITPSLQGTPNENDCEGFLFFGSYGSRFLCHPQTSYSEWH